MKFTAKGFAYLIPALAFCIYHSITVYSMRYEFRIFDIFLEIFEYARLRAEVTSKLKAKHSRRKDKRSMTEVTAPTYIIPAIRAKNFIVLTIIAPDNSTHKNQARYFL